MHDCCDLELTIHRQDTNYAVDFRFSRAGASDQVDRTGMAAAFDLEALQSLLMAANFPEYGSRLTDQLFQDTNLKTAFAEARSVANSLDNRLRLRLNIHTDSSELYKLRWEMLGDPDSRSSLSTDQKVYFSRYYSSASFKGFRARPRKQLKALIMVAAPSDIEEFEGLAKVPRQSEEEAISASLGDIPCKKMEHASLSGLVRELTADEYDVVYLVAHGRYIPEKKDGFLYLEGEDGNADVVSSARLVEEVARLAQPPRLMVLASCQSGGSGTGDVLSALGPRLADAGIPAVMAMQANIEIETNALFMPLFFKELQKDGQIDRALSVARSQVHERSDYWVPVLFMRLKDGRLWEVPAEQLVSQGAEAIKASAEIIKLSPETYARTVKSFEIASQQISRMADYKDLHDGLHRLQYDVYNMAMDDKRSFPADDGSRRRLQRNLDQLDRILIELNAIASRPGVNPVEKKWVQEIDEARQLFKEALRNKDAAALKEALSVLDGVLADRPTRINGILTEAAHALQLDALAEALHSTTDGLPAGNQEAAQLGKIEAGAMAIQDLSRKLTSLVNDHDGWQDIAIDLRRLEGDGKLAELKLMWRRLKRKASELYQERQEDWALELRETSDALDQAIAADNPGSIVDQFLAYNSQVGTRFFNVDCDLKSLCTEIRDISSPLKEVIDSIGRTAK